MGTDSLIILLILCFAKTIHSFCIKYTSSYLNKFLSFVKHGAFQLSVAAIASGGFFIYEIGKYPPPTPVAVIISISSALCLFCCTLCSMIAMKSGTVGLVVLAMSSGLLVPTIASAFLFDEKVSLIQFIGIAVLIFTFYITASNSKTIYTNFSAKTVLLLIGAMLSNGGVMLMQKLYGAYVPNGSAGFFSFVAFGGSSVILAVITLFLREKNNKIEHKKQKKSVIFASIGVGVSLLIMNILAIGLSKKIPSVVQFTAVDGSGLIIAVIMASIFFKEKFTKKNVFAVCLGIFALVLINI